MPSKTSDKESTQSVHKNKQTSYQKFVKKYKSEHPEKKLKDAQHAWKGQLHIKEIEQETARTRSRSRSRSRSHSALRRRRSPRKHHGSGTQTDIADLKSVLMQRLYGGY